LLPHSPAGPSLLPTPRRLLEVALPEKPENQGVGPGCQLDVKNPNNGVGCGEGSGQTDNRGKKEEGKKEPEEIKEIIIHQDVKQDLTQEHTAEKP
jgi:hypothetical protein